jgi:hypothetical protein
MSGSYKIRYSDNSKDGFPITVVDDTTFNGVGTGNLTLVGRNYPAYGQAFAENFIHLLENAASPVPPINPIEGQLWFDTSDPTNKKLRINDGAANNTLWKPINGIFQQATEPTNAALGDIWVNTSLGQLKIYNGASFEFPEWYDALTGTGTKPVSLTDNFSGTRNIVETRADDTIVQIISTATFQPNPSISGFPQGIKSGVNVATGYKIYGTSEKAESLIVNNVAISGAQFLRKDINQTLNGQLWISQDSNALLLGTAKTFIIERSVSGINANFVNSVNEGSFTFNTKNTVGGNVTSLVIRGNPQQVEIPTKTDATSTTTGALVVGGGVGVGENLHVGGDVYIKHRIVANNVAGTVGQVLTTDANGVVRWSNFNSNGFTGGTVTGILATSDTTESTSTATGALLVTGGAGIGKNVNIGGNLAVVGNLTVNGIVSSGTTITTTTFQTNQIISTTNTTQSTSTNSGALIVAGGAGIAKDLWIGGDLDVAGTIFMKGVGLNTISGSTGTFDFLIVEGTGTGLAVTNNVTVGGNTNVTGVSTSSKVQTALLAVSGASTLTTLTVTGASTLTTVIVTSNSAATTTTNGALQVVGGVGIQGSLYVGGEIVANKLTIQLTTVTTTLVQTDDIIQTLNTETAVSVVSGSIRTAGGIGVAKDIYVGGNVYSTGGNPLVNFNTATLVANAVAAEQFKTARTITFTGDVTGSFSLDGTQNTGTALTIQPNSIALGTDTVGDYISTGTTTGFGISGSASGEGTTFTVTSNGTSTNTANTLVYRTAAGDFAGGIITAATFSGSAASLTNIPGGQINAGSIPNTALTSSTIGFTAGSNIGISRASAALGDTVIITNLGVQTVTGSTYLGTSAATGTITLTNLGVQTLTGTSALAVSASTGTITLTNLGVTAAAGTTYLGVSGSTGSVTFTNLGVQTLTGTSAIAVSASTGTITLTNLGVTSAAGTTYLGVSGSTGTITFTNLGVQTLTGTTALGVSSSTGTITLTNLGVQTLTGGTDTSVSSTTGTVTVWSNSTLQSVTGRGATTTNAITITNATNSTSTNTGALVVTGGVGVGNNLYVNNDIVIGTASSSTNVVTKAHTGYNRAYDTVVTVNNLQARVTTSGVPQIKAATTAMNVFWSASQIVFATTDASNIVNTGAVLSTSTWTAIGIANNITNGGDTAIANVQDQDTGKFYRITYIHTAGASSASAVIERLI